MYVDDRGLLRRLRRGALALVGLGLLVVLTGVVVAEASGLLVLAGGVLVGAAALVLSPVDACIRFR